MYVKTHTAQLSRPVRTIMVRREGLLLSTRRYTMRHAVADFEPEYGS